MNNGSFFLDTLEILTILFITLLGVGLVFVTVIYIIDRNQTVHAIRRNYPVIGRFRYWFEHLGTFFRQYFFTMDREELPFNRAERSWVYRAAKNISNTVAFGSTRDLKPAGTVIFVNCPFPTLGKDAVKPKPVKACKGGPDVRVFKLITRSRVRKVQFLVIIYTARLKISFEIFGKCGRAMIRASGAKTRRGRELTCVVNILNVVGAIIQLAIYYP